MDLNFPKQNYKIQLSNRVVGDLEYKQRVNWRSKNRIKRERANLMFDRLHTALFDIANSENLDFLTEQPNKTYSYTVTDNFATLIFELWKLEDGLLLYLKDILWPYKKDPKGWWYIVDNLNTMDNLTLIMRIMEFEEL